jgi:hypothetical protein
VPFKTRQLPLSLAGSSSREQNEGEVTAHFGLAKGAISARHRNSDRRRGAEIHHSARRGTRLLSAIDERDLHDHGAGERRTARRRPESRRPSCPKHYEAILATRLHSGESGVIFLRHTDRTTRKEEAVSPETQPHHLRCDLRPPARRSSRTTTLGAVLTHICIISILLLGGCASNECVVSGQMNWSNHTYYTQYCVLPYTGNSGDACSCGAQGGRIPMVP